MKHSKRLTLMGLILILVAVGLLLMGALGLVPSDPDVNGLGKLGGWMDQARADIAPVDNPVYAEECGACHFAYQPGLLPARSWSRIMEPAALSDHYGDDASLPDALRNEISTYLSDNAADKAKRSQSRAFASDIVVNDQRGALPRISETRYFKKVHDEIPQRLVRNTPDVGRFSQCNACHRRADQGIYSRPDTMSTMNLAILIGALILVQVAIFGVLGLYRHRARYHELDQRDNGPSAPSVPMALTGQAATAAWSGYRDFVVQRRVIEDDNASVCSFDLIPADGAPLPPFRPGQYLTFKLDVTDPSDGTLKTVVRCYSLSDRPQSDRYRVSIKRVPAPPGQPEVAPVMKEHLECLRDTHPGLHLHVCYGLQPGHCLLCISTPATDLTLAL